VARLTINLEDGGLSELDDGSPMIFLDDDESAEIIVTGLKNGMVSGAPSVALGFKLPTGETVVAQTSWRLFATAFHALAGKFGTAYPEMQGVELLHDGKAGISSYQIIPDDQLRFVQCEHCGSRQEFAPESEGGQPFEPIWWLHAHYREDHPDLTAPPRARCGTAWGAAVHSWVKVGPDNPLSKAGWSDLCEVCGELRK
jgi:hypothetical protein